jgi:hypothetical protein
VREDGVDVRSSRAEPEAADVTMSVNPRLPDDGTV